MDDLSKSKHSLSIFARGPLVLSDSSCLFESIVFVFSTLHSSQVFFPRRQNPRAEHRTFNPLLRSAKRAHHSFQPALKHLVEEQPDRFFRLRTRRIVRYTASSTHSSKRGAR